MPVEKLQAEKTQTEPAQDELTPAERWRQVESLFHRALECAPAERAAFLAQACPAESLRREVESLLASHAAGGSLLENAASDLAAEWSQANRPQTNLQTQSENQKIQSLGPYQILSPLGKGGMGEVYLAEDTRLGRKVALKILPAEFTDRKERLRRFELEARAASATNHPNIITIYEIGKIEAIHFIAAEFVEGLTLRALLNTRQLELREALDIAVQVASALAAAHAAGIRHRDIKPENIMVRPDGLVKVLDFGLAKLSETPVILADPNATTVAEMNTAPGVVIGTVQYMSPEQARGQEVDHRTDIFSLGVVLYEMLAGRVPFDGDATIEVLASIVHRPPVRLQQAAPGTPMRLEQIVTRALSKDRQQRYQTAEEMLAELKDLKQELELEARLGRVSQIAARQTIADRSTAGEQTTQVQTAKTTEAEHKTFVIPPAGGSAAVKPPEGGATNTVVNAAAVEQAKRRVLTGVIVMALLVAVFFGPRIWRSLSGEDSTPIDSLAVLPFINVGNNPEIDYLCEGVAESLINRLSPHLKVISRGASFRFKGRESDVAAIGRELDVQAVLIGRIAQRGNELLIQVELVGTEDNRQIWGEKYSRRLSGVVADEEIANDISTRLRLQLSGEDRRRLARRYTANPEAQRLYLTGRQIWNKRRRDEYGKAIEAFNQALEKDPAYALAYAGLADVYVLGGGASSGAEAFARAKAAATKALEIDETLAEAHAALAQTRIFHDWDLVAAKAEFERAIALNPNYAPAHQWYADCLTLMGRTEEALAQMKLASASDPFSLSIIRDTGRILYYSRRYDEAIAQCQTAIGLDARFYPAVVTLGDSLLQKGNYPEAIASYQKAVDLSGGMALMKSLLANAYAVSGDRGAAQMVLDELLASSKEKSPPAFNLAVIYIGLGNKAEALNWLERAYHERYYRLVYIGVDPLFDPLRGEARFNKLLQEMDVAPGQYRDQ